jgi:hypothetical protein
MVKELKTRIQHKHDTEANWKKAVNFVPLAGELIIYDADIESGGEYSYERFKIGDGKTPVNELVFYKANSSNWNQNDETALDYVKNRTHYTEIDEIVVLEKTTFTDVSIEGEAEFTSAIALEKGQTYAVTWNGVEYVCTAAIFEDEAIWFGNPIVFGSGDNGIPFFVVGYGTDCILLPCDSSTTVTMSITAVKENVHFLDPKYIKDMYCEKVKTVLPKTSISIEEESHDFGPISYGQLIAGQTYHVIINDIEYNCIAREWINGGNDSVVLIGNGTIYGDGNVGNNEPFSFDSYENGHICINTDNGDYTISISTINIHTIDPKYLPDNENDALDIVVEMGLVEPVVSDTGAIYIDENKMIYTL